MNHYPHHIGDRLKDSAHFTLQQHGVHIRLMEVYYTQEKPFKDTATACLLIGAKTAKEKADVVMVLASAFKETPDGWMQTRCEKELTKYREKSAKAAESADARWGKTKCERNANASDSGMRTHTEGNANQEPITKNQEPNKNKRGQAACTRPDDVPEKIWNDFQAIRKAKRAPLTQTALDGIALEAKRAGMSLAAALGECCARGWQGFKSDWIIKNTNGIANGVDYGQCTWNLNGDREVGGRCENHAAGLHKSTGMARCAVHIARN